MGLDINFYKNKRISIRSFRKVNFLVAFFENIGYEVQNLKPITIEKEDAEELMKRCDRVLEDNNVAKELLPTREGFFYGSTEYDDTYFSDVKEVRDCCRDELIPMFDDLDDDETIEFYIWY